MADRRDVQRGEPTEPWSPQPVELPGRGGLPAGPSFARQALRPAALLLLTFITTTASGAIRQHPGVDFPFWQMAFPVDAIRPISDGLSYSVPLLLILLCHELGHYFMARRHGVHASLPHFIPLPPVLGLGTMGAVIGMRKVTADRRKLIDIGAAGPIAGLVVAVPVLIYGLSLSPVIALHPGGMQEGNSILYGALKLLSKGLWLPSATEDVNLHPTAFAGWTGLLITMINLLPIGQLDGGHIATAYFGNGYNRFARWVHRLLPVVALSVFGWTMEVVRRETLGTNRWELGTALEIAVGAAFPWLLWWVMVAMVRRASGSADHPPVDRHPLPRSRRVLFWVVALMFAALLMPTPMRTSLAGVEPMAARATGDVALPTVGPEVLARPATAAGATRPLPPGRGEKPAE
jgi:membrane-associated protease RseP (regulator of RpoE activity)